MIYEKQKRSHRILNHPILGSGHIGLRTLFNRGAFGSLFASRVYLSLPPLFNRQVYPLLLQARYQERGRFVGEDIGSFVFRDLFSEFFARQTYEL